MFKERSFQGLAEALVQSQASQRPMCMEFHTLPHYVHRGIYKVRYSFSSLASCAVRISCCPRGLTVGPNVHEPCDRAEGSPSCYWLHCRAMARHHVVNRADGHSIVGVTASSGAGSRFAVQSRGKVDATLGVSIMMVISVRIHNQVTTL